MITGRQISAARALIGKTQPEIAKLANISVPTLKRMEGSDGEAAGSRNNVLAVQSVLEAAGIIFIDGTYSGAGGPGCRLATPAGKSIDVVESEVIQYPDHLKHDAPPGAGG